LPLLPETEAVQNGPENDVPPISDADIQRGIEHVQGHMNEIKSKHQAACENHSEGKWEDGKCVFETKKVTINIQMQKKTR
jgi:hypothetical protein